METTTALKLLAITLVFIFIIGPTTASPKFALTGFESGKSAIIAEYKSSSTLSLSPNLKPDWVTSDPKVLFDSAKSDLHEKNLWKAFPDFVPYCSTCAFKNSTENFESMWMQNYESKFKGFYFGGGAAGTAGGGSGCC